MSLSSRKWQGWDSVGIDVSAELLGAPKSHVLIVDIVDILLARAWLYSIARPQVSSVGVLASKCLLYDRSTHGTFQTCIFITILLNSGLHLAA